MPPRIATAMFVSAASLFSGPYQVFSDCFVHYTPTQPFEPPQYTSLLSFNGPGTCDLCVTPPDQSSPALARTWISGEDRPYRPSDRGFWDLFPPSRYDPAVYGKLEFWPLLARAERFSLGPLDDQPTIWSYYANAILRIQLWPELRDRFFGVEYDDEHWGSPGPLWMGGEIVLIGGGIPGVTVGETLDCTHLRGFWVTQIPEPSTAVLLVGGTTLLVILAGWRALRLCPHLRSTPENTSTAPCAGSSRRAPGWRSQVDGGARSGSALPGLL